MTVTVWTNPNLKRAGANVLILVRAQEGRVYVYVKPKYNEFLGEVEKPSVEDVAQTIGRKNGWLVRPDGDMALNMLGLSTQVPASWTFVSDGPYIPPDAKAVLAAADVRVGRHFGEIAKGIYLSGRIERTSGEDNGKSFYCDETCTERDYVLEEQALLTEDGVLVTGCCHAGIMNTVQTFRRVVPHIAIRTIVGGLHLCHATDEEIEQAGDFLRQLNLDQLVLLHCTGEAAGAKLKEMLSCPVVWGVAGSVLIEAPSC